MRGEHFAHLFLRIRLIVELYGALGELHKDIVEHYLAHFLIRRHLQVHNEAHSQVVITRDELIVRDELRCIIEVSVGHFENQSF